MISRRQPCTQKKILQRKYLEKLREKEKLEYGDRSLVTVKPLQFEMEILGNRLR